MRALHKAKEMTRPPTCVVEVLGKGLEADPPLVDLWCLVRPSGSSAAAALWPAGVSDSRSSGLQGCTADLSDRWPPCSPRSSKRGYWKRRATPRVTRRTGRRVSSPPNWLSAGERCHCPGRIHISLRLEEKNHGLLGVARAQKFGRRIQLGSIPSRRCSRREGCGRCARRRRSSRSVCRRGAARLRPNSWLRRRVLPVRSYERIPRERIETG